MESAAGAALVLLGVLIVIFGRATTRSPEAAVRPPFVPAWFDAVLTWAIGVACAAFGAQLLLGHAHYF
jgi:hypothetical protein